MKKRLILKVLGLLLLLPMFSGCNDTDDVAGIFTGKTWKLTIGSLHSHRTERISRSTGTGT